ncbi:NFACT family protein, partial [Candidatus Micrarchaeota archaeon]|nr:NFACT family protein [Candidatus Micrarchaeota archaeon]
MRSMNNIEYAFVIRELQTLIGKHFENAYSPSDSLLRIRIGGIDIICEPGKRLHITKYIEEGELSQFAKILRKELENARLKDVYQHNNDRVIVFSFNNAQLIFEMFADGNAILVKDEKTVAALQYEEWSDRKIARGEQYKFPKSNIKENVNDAINAANEKYIIVALMQLPLGKDYAADIL